jgi:hypothetical protein
MVPAHPNRPRLGREKRQVWGKTVSITRGFGYLKTQSSQIVWPRGTNSLVMQRVESIFKKLFPSLDEMLSARIAINLDQCRPKKIN